MPRRAGPSVLPATRPSRLLGIAAAALVVASTTALVFPLRTVAPVVSLGVVYLVAVLLIVLVDVTPGALIARLQAGKVYPQERVEAALNHFFRIENLAALREIALREVAEEVETKRRVSPFAPEREALGTRDDRPQPPSASAQAIQERLLALITPEPPSQRVVRRAARSAQRLDGELDLLYVRPYGREPSAQEREQLEALRRLSSVLGCHLLIEEGDDVAEVAARVARDRGTTYVLMGVPRGRRGLRRFGEPLHDRLLKLLPGVDLRIVADREGDRGT